MEKRGKWLETDADDAWLMITVFISLNDILPRRLDTSRRIYTP